MLELENYQKKLEENLEKAFQFWTNESQLLFKKIGIKDVVQRTEGSIIKQDNQQELLEQNKPQNQMLQSENQTTKSTFQYDKVKGWYRWIDLKLHLEPHYDKLKKCNYEKIFYEAGLKYGKDYVEVVFDDCKFPTCMVSLTAIPKIISYLSAYIIT